ncbi:MAG: hypothetical protein LBF00_03100 [Mycoplasmataceae bacterium]|jgi:hypothetical protein|nr:hypothetical protein [Mycoplasmataceae bacterium]
MPLKQLQEGIKSEDLWAKIGRDALKSVFWSTKLGQNMAKNNNLVKLKEK